MQSIRKRLAPALAAFATLVSPAALAETAIRGTADLNGTPTAVELRLDEAAGEIRFRPAYRSKDWMRLPLTYPSDVLPILADTRLQFLWAPIEAWAGEDLTRMRDRTVAATRAAWEQGSAGAKPSTAMEGSARKPIRAMLQHAEALAQAGRLAEALAILETQRARMPFKTLTERAEWGMVSQLVASVQNRMGDKDAAIVTLAQTGERLADTPFRLNASISRAAYLAEVGRYAEALELADATHAAFLENHKSAAGSHKSGQPVPGASLQFDWVRACALRGSGRKEEAAALMQRISAAEQPTHKRLVPPDNTDVLQTGHSCARDPEALTALWGSVLADLPIGASSIVVAQPAFHSEILHPPTLERARELFKVAAPMRILPARYTPALRYWQ
jgi:tetratricopeptide (TPR) repeat protein